MQNIDLFKQINKNQKLHKEEYTKLLELDPVWLVNYLTDMIIEKDEEFENAIHMSSKSSVMALIEQYLY